MASVNVRSDVSDVFYRYKMPRLQAKIEGKGNGIKTVIPNIPDIGRSLKRPPHYATKFFGCELGAHVQFDPKNDRYIVYGAHDASDLQLLLDGFIKKFVLCESCGNPETELKISGGSKDQTLWKSCKACGNRNMADMRHKLISYVLKNPPNGFAEYYGGAATNVNRDGTAVVDDKDKRKGKKKSRKNRDREDDSPKEDHDASVNGSTMVNGEGGSPELTGIDQEAMPVMGAGLDFGGSAELLGLGSGGLPIDPAGLAALQTNTQVFESLQSPRDDGDDSDSDWAEDTSEAAMKKRMADLHKSMNTTLVLGEAEDDLDEAKDIKSPDNGIGKKKRSKKSKADKEPMSPVADDDDASAEGEDGALDKLAEFLSGFVGQEESTTPAPTKKLKSQIADLNIKNSQAVLVYMQVCFTKQMIKSKEIEAHASNLRAMVEGSDSSQKVLLGGLERFLGATSAGKKLLPKTAIILKKLYDEDIIDEAVLRKWGQKVSKKYVKKEVARDIRKKAQPFLDWLEEDDEDESE